MSKEKLLLVDGSSYLYRAFHALPDLRSSDGRPTGAIYGVLNMLQKLIKSERPDYLSVILTHRSKLLDMIFFLITKQIGKKPLKT